MRVEPITTTRRRFFGAAVLVAALAAASFAPARAAAEELTVKIDNFTFTPERLTVKVGTTVTWVNGDDIPHNIAASNRAFKSKVMDTEEKFSFTFTTPGSYEYFCALHPHMMGMVVVEGTVGPKAP